MVGEKALKGVKTALKSANLSAEYEIRIADTGNTAKSLNDAFNQLSNVKDVTFIVGIIPDELLGDLSTMVNQAKIPTVIFPLTADENTGGPYLINIIIRSRSRRRFFPDMRLSTLARRHSPCCILNPVWVKA